MDVWECFDVDSCWYYVLLMFGGGLKTQGTRYKVENPQFWTWNANLGSKSWNVKATKYPGLEPVSRTLWRPGHGQPSAVASRWKPDSYGQSASVPRFCHVDRRYNDGKSRYSPDTVLEVFSPVLLFNSNFWYFFLSDVWCFQLINSSNMLPK